MNEDWVSSASGLSVSNRNSSSSFKCQILGVYDLPPDLWWKHYHRCDCHVIMMSSFMVQPLRNIASLQVTCSASRCLPGPSQTHLPWRCWTAESRRSGQRRQSQQHGSVQPAWTPSKTYIKATSGLAHMFMPSMFMCLMTSSVSSYRSLNFDLWHQEWNEPTYCDSGNLVWNLTVVRIQSL